MIVEPMAGSTGVLPPPKGYLERLRAICSEHGILLIFDEVITGFGRLGAPFAAQRFGVQPDMIAMAKGMTNGTIPMGGVAVRSHVYDALMQGPIGTIELMHGYTYSGHPAACGALIATLQIYAREKLFERARELETYWEEAVHMLRQAPNVADVRNIGLVGGIELKPLEGRPGARGSDVYRARLRRRAAGPGDGRHDRYVAAADHLRAADRRDRREARQRDRGILEGAR